MLSVEGRGTLPLCRMKRGKIPSDILLIFVCEIKEQV